MFEARSVHVTKRQNYEGEIDECPVLFLNEKVLCGYSW